MIARDTALTIAGAFIGSALGIAVTVLILNPQESLERLDLLEREQQTALAISELSMLTDLILSCDAGTGPNVQVRAGTTASGGGADGAGGLGGVISEVPDPRPVHLNTDEIVEFADVVVGRNEAWGLVRAGQFEAARDHLRTVRDDYLNSLCYRDIAFERGVAAMSICDATASEIGWGFVYRGSAKEGCSDGVSVPLCEAIVKDGQVITHRRDDGALVTTAARILQACGLWSSAEYEPAQDQEEPVPTGPSTAAQSADGSQVVE